MEHGECKTLMERNVKGGERYMYLVCDFNGKWLKDSSFLCCVDILLRVEGRVVDIMQVGCFLEIIFLHFFYRIMRLPTW
jgi:hypothetical protein